MRDSTTYQAILDEGRAEGEMKGRSEGQVEEARKLLLLLGRKHLGSPDPLVEASVRAIADVERLERMIECVSDVATWQDLLQTP